MLLEEACEQAEKKANKNIFDYLAYVYRYIEGQQDGSDLLRQFVEHIFEKFSVDKNADLTVISKENLGELIGKYRTLIDGYVEYLVSEHMQEEEFYRRLWSIIHDRTLFRDDQASMIAFMLVVRSPLLPYFYLPDGLQMGNEAFRDCMKKLDMQLKKVRFILECNYSQKTERASVLLSVLDETEDKAEKSVLMAKILDWVVENNKEDDE